MNNVSASDMPDAFWDVNTKYAKALETNDNPNIIKYGNELISIAGNMEDTQQKYDILVTRYNAVGKAYAALGDYDSSAKVFKELYKCGLENSDKYYDYIVSAKARVDQYTSDIRMYTEGGISPYYGAKNEKQNGVLFGACSNGGVRSRLDNESMILVYQELGQSLLPYNTSIVSSARASGCAVEFALNCPNQSKDISDIKQMGSYLKEISELFDKYSDVPVFLRFAAEFDIWDKHMADPESYKAAFRYVSDYFKSRNTNVAMVWSPNQVSRWDIDIDDYYPGDKYVDWVGMSLYAQKYFLGSKNSEEENEIVFKTGINSEPVIAVKNIIDKYGSRKPIMLSESGCGHRVTNLKENTTDFALRRLKEYYSYLPMVYPQIKLMAYFDHYIEGETNDYRLSSNSELCNEYLKLTRTGRFIQDTFDNSAGLCYREITDGTDLGHIFTVSCYGHMYNDVMKSVVYYIDGNYLGMSNEIPFTTYVDVGGYYGKHTLTSVALFESGKQLVCNSDVNIDGTASDITVNISGKEISFDQKPIIYNDRTMVPMRKIFEELGASVSWDSASRTAIGTRGDRTIKIEIGSDKMLINTRTVDLDTPPFILAGRTLVPVRAIAEGLGCDVGWDGRTYTVDITPKIFRWSEWMERLPDSVNKDMYYIEEKTQYRWRQKEYLERPYKMPLSTYVRTDTTYGDWEDWQKEYISESDDIDVETRTRSTPVKYHFAHWCTGNISNPDLRYRSGNYRFCDEVTYHDLGWFDSPIPHSEDSDTDYTYYVNGEKYRCSNSCWRWFLFETSGGEYTEYRWRKIYKTYVYWQWGMWSDFSDYNPGYGTDMEVDTMTLYRYKEK